MESATIAAVLPAACAREGSRAALTAFVRAADFDPAEIVDIYQFGYDAELIDALAELVVSGPKRATTSLLRWYVSGTERLPLKGDLALVVASDCVPRAVIRVTSVEIAPFDRVDARFAWDEGEGDRSLAYWREAHRRFFESEAERANVTFREDDDVVLCRFALLWPDRPRDERS